MDQDAKARVPILKNTDKRTNKPPVVKLIFINWDKFVLIKNKHFSASECI